MVRARNDKSLNIDHYIQKSRDINLYCHQLLIIHYPFLFHPNCRFENKSSYMKFTLRFVLLIGLFVGATSMFMQKTTHIVFFGDSITQAGAQAGGYITKIGEALLAKGIANQYVLTGAGIGGNKVYDLYLRMDSDVLAKNPDVVVI